MCNRRQVSAMFLVTWLFVETCSADDAKPAVLTPAQQERLKERDRYAAETTKLRAAGKLAEAVAACQKKLAIEREVLGNHHKESVGSLRQLAGLYEMQQDFAAAGQALQEVLNFLSQQHGSTSWQTGDARRALDDLKRRRTWTAGQRQQWQESRRLNRQIEDLWRR